MRRKSRMKRERRKDKRNLRRKVKKNLRRKAKENVNRKGEEKGIMGNHYKKGLRILRDLVKRAQFDGFTFIYEPGLYGGASALAVTNKNESPYIMMISHVGSAIASIINANPDIDEQKLLDDIIKLVKIDLSSGVTVDKIEV